EEITAGVQRNAAHDVGQRGAKEDGQKQARDAKQKIPKRIPHPADDVIAKFDGGATQDQQPQNNHQWQIESAEPAGVENGKGKIKRASGRQQPNFVAIPDRPDRSQDLAPLLVSLGHQQMDGTGTEIEAVQQDVHG